MDDRYLIVGTAGHIDHGKTTLLRGLTGVNLDTLPEERERGITISLGFTYLSLESGRRLAFVDVPGHERFVRTMIAGAGGLDAALLCVSAVDGVMPQTREHVAILELLGVVSGVVALTFADAVDEDYLELALEDVQDTLSGTALAEWPVLACSGLDGRGLVEIKAALEQLPKRASFRDLAGAKHPFRLPVDRVFTRHGHGTVITGTARSGRVAVGDDLEVRPSGERVRVRGIQVHGESVQEAGPGFRTALNVSLAHDQIGRGFEVASAGSVPDALVLDVAYRHLEAAPELVDGATVRLLIGTREVLGRVQFLSDSANNSESVRFLQLRLGEPIAALPGDRFVLRRESPMETMGGGVVLDPWAATVRKKGRMRASEELERLHAGDTSVFLIRAGRRGLSPTAAAQRAPEQGVVLGGVVLASTVLAELEKEIRNYLVSYHRTHPLLAGATAVEVRQGLRPRPDLRVTAAVLDRMAESGGLTLKAGRAALSDFCQELNVEQQACRQRILEHCGSLGFKAPNRSELLEAGADPDSDALIALLREEGELIKVGAFFFSRSLVEQVVVQVNAWLDAEGCFTPADVKDRFGVTRKHLIPLLEWLDSERITRRDGDVRRRANRRTD